MRRIVAFSTALVLLALIRPTGARAQSVNGHVIGTVRDASGAVVPGVAMTLRNTNRNEIVQTGVSDDDGEYAFRNLPPSVYAMD